MCTSSAGGVTLDSQPHSWLNCEIVWDSRIIFVTFYVSQDDEIIGGVTSKREYQEYLELETPGFLLERWSFARQ